MNRNAVVQENLGLARVVSRRVARLPGVRLDPEDAYQEASLGLVQVLTDDRVNLDRHPKEVAGYLATTMYRRVCKLRDKITCTVSQEVPACLPSRDASPSEQVEREEMSACLRAQVARLPDIQRQLLSLVFGLDDGLPMTCMEASGILGFSHQYGSRVYREALETLRNRCQLLTPTESEV